MPLIMTSCNGLLEAIHLAKEPDIKALVITGKGDRAFCSGGDLSVFHQLYIQMKKHMDAFKNVKYSLFSIDFA